MTVQWPDATQHAYASPVNDSTGLYHQDVPVTDLATPRPLLRTSWTATGTGAGVSFGDFDVFDPFEPALLPLQDAKDALNIPQATTSYDSEIQQYIATIETCIERMTGGPLVNRTHQRTRGPDPRRTRSCEVRCRPLVSVTSIVSVASGQALDLSAGLDIDPIAGTIRRKLGYPFYGPYFTWLPAMTDHLRRRVGRRRPRRVQHRGPDHPAEPVGDAARAQCARPQMGGGTRW